MGHPILGCLQTLAESLFDYWATELGSKDFWLGRLGTYGAPAGLPLRLVLYNIIRGGLAVFY